MELKSIQDWIVAKYLKSVADVVDDSSFGGITREYQVRLDPEKLISYGLSLAQVEQQLTNANANGGGSFVEQGLQQINVRAIGLVNNTQDIQKTVLKVQSGTAVRVKDIAYVTQGPKIRLGQIGKAIRKSDGVVFDDNDVVEGIVFLRKGADTETTLDGIHAMVQKLNDRVLPPGVRIVPFLDRDDLVHYTTHTVLHNLAEGMILVVLILFVFLGNIRGALIVALTIPFALLFASICLKLRHISANLLSLGALDFGMVVDGAVVMVENIVRHLSRPASSDCDHHHGVSADFHTATSRRKIVSPHGIDSGVRAARLIDFFNDCGARARDFSLPKERQAMAEPRNGVSHGPLPASGRMVGPPALGHSRSGSRVSGRGHLSGCRWSDRIGVLAASRRRSHLGAGNLGAEHRAHGRDAGGGSGAKGLVRISRGSASCQPGGPAGRRHRHDWIFQHGILRRSVSKGEMAADFPPG
jgi:hypothetical protein